MSKNIAPARYWDGSLKHPNNGVPVTKMTIMDKVENEMAPDKSSKPQKRDLATENLIENGKAPGPPPPMMTLNKVEFSLLTLDNADGKLYDAYITEVGKKRREAVMAVIKDSGWKTLDAGRGSDRAAMLQRAI
ncbi:MAG: hypothetical protein GY815_10925, partial [Gammaproteobacteria bacterium]|nr:hypothetical protein [Gammaproteobacteria bacterium]